MAVHMNNSTGFDEDAPRPVDADVVASGAFDRLEQGQGAVSVKSRQASGEAPAHGDEAAPHMSKRTLAIVGACALVVIVLIVTLFVRVLDAPAPTEEQEVEPEQVSVAADESITSHGTSYELAENDGVYQLVEVREGAGSTVSLGDLPGVPVNLVLYDGAIIVPENLQGGSWDVMAYTIGSGWSQIMDQDGNAMGGSGEISDAQLDGSVVALTVDGTRVDVPLVW